MLPLSFSLSTPPLPNPSSFILFLSHRLPSINHFIHISFHIVSRFMHSQLLPLSARSHVVSIFSDSAPCCSSSLCRIDSSQSYRWIDYSWGQDSDLGSGLECHTVPCHVPIQHTACLAVWVCVCLCVFLLFQHCGSRFIRKNTDVTDRSLIFLRLNSSQLSLVRFFKLCMCVTFPTIHTKSHTHTYTQSPISYTPWTEMCNRLCRHSSNTLTSLRVQTTQFKHRRSTQTHRGAHTHAYGHAHVYTGT